jgi:hypothetical protein
MHRIEGDTMGANSKLGSYMCLLLHDVTFMPAGLSIEGIETDVKFERIGPSCTLAKRRPN